MTVEYNFFFVDLKYEALCKMVIRRIECSYSKNKTLMNQSATIDWMIIFSSCLLGKMTVAYKLFI